MSATSHNRASTGFSLVELLIAMTLGLFLIAGMVTVFSGNQRSSELNAAMTDIQEGARFAVEAIARDARMAGYQGCVNSNSNLLKVKAKKPKFDLRATSSSGSIVQADKSWSPVQALGYVPPASRPGIPGTHTLTLQYASPRQFALAEQMQVDTTASLAGPVVVTGKADIAKDDLAIIADCDDANLFRVTGVSAAGSTTTLNHAASGNDDGNLEKAYGSTRTLAQTTVMKFLSNTYYIADTGLDNSRGDSIRALYQQSLPYHPTDNPPIELIRGVDDMRIAFGVRTGAGVRYLRPGASFDASDVESIRLGLLMSSWEPVANQDDTNTYLLAGQKITPPGSTQGVDQHAGDRRIRLAFNTTIKIRNRRES